MVYIDNLLPRDDILISNKYYLINNSNDDFHYVIYYINNKKCKIIIRRLDNNNGWSINLKIKIDNDTFSIGSSNKNYKIINLYINSDLILVKDKIYNQKIPKIIFQTIGNKNIENIQLYNSILTYLELNTEYEYRLFDDLTMREFIKNNFEESFLIAFDMLIAGAFKADFFRYCYLYINGGFYADCKSILRTRLKNIINANDDFILCKDIGIGYFNAVMASSPNNPHLLKTINDCVDNIYNFNKKYNMNHRDFNLADNILSLTGPVLLFNSINKDINKSKVIKFYHKNDVNKIHLYQRLFIEYNNNIIITKNYSGHNPNGLHYSQLWFNREILYLHTYSNNNYKFYQFNYHVKDLFKFHIIDSKSFIIERLDDNCGWGNILKVKIIDENTNKELKVEVGNSNHNNKLITINEDFFVV